MLFTNKSPFADLLHLIVPGEMSQINSQFNLNYPRPQVSYTYPQYKPLINNKISNNKIQKLTRTFPKFKSVNTSLIKR